MSPKLEKPPVHITGSGVPYVKPADILNSVVGQAEIRKTVDSSFYQRLLQESERPEPTEPAAR